MICGNPIVEWHHAIHVPAGSRGKASEDGLVLPLCPEHHRTGRDAPHRNAVTDKLMMTIAEQAWMLNEALTEDEKADLICRFRRRYGWNKL